MRLKVQLFLQYEMREKGRSDQVIIIRMMLRLGYEEKEKRNYRGEERLNADKSYIG